MNGSRQTTSSLKDQIQTAADRRDIELDSIKLIEEGDELRVFRVLETDADAEADQVGFQVTHPGGPAGDNMFRRHLNNAMDNLQAHLNGEDPAEPTSDDTTDELEELVEAETESTAPNDELDARQDQMASDEREHDNTASVATTELTVSFDAEQIEEIREMFEETAEQITDSHDELDERLDELDERITRLEDALGGLAQISADD